LFYKNNRINRNNPPDTTIVTGRVTSQAMRILLTVFIRRFFKPLAATIDPATPEDNTWVVLTGNPNSDDAPIVVAVTICELKPCA
jgi:hypothetical protein